MSYYIKALKHYFDFKGRATRKEFWMFVLFNIIIQIVLTIVDAVIGTDNIGNGGLLVNLYSLAVLIPGFAVTVRRLHDIGKSGWWILIVFVPLIGVIWLIVLLATDSEAGDNAYGPRTKNTVA